MAQSKPSGVSATYEEWNTAKDLKPVLVFVEEGVDREPRQAAFIQEVEAWASGRFRAGFRDARELRIKVGQNLMDWQRSVATAPVDEAEMQARAAALLPPTNRGGFSYNGPVLTLAVVGGPRQRLVRPIEIEDRALGESMRQAALFGETRLYDGTKGVVSGVDGAALNLTEERGGSVHLEEDGSVRVSGALSGSTRQPGVYAIADEDVHTFLTSALTYAAWLLERIDATQRVTHVAVAVSLAGAEHMPWMTRAEIAASNGSYSMGMGSAQKTPVHAAMPRSAFRLDRTHLVDDLLVPLRRQWPRGAAGGSRFGTRIV